MVDPRIVPTSLSVYCSIESGEENVSARCPVIVELYKVLHAHRPSKRTNAGSSVGLRNLKPC